MAPARRVLCPLSGGCGPALLCGLGACADLQVGEGLVVADQHSTDEFIMRLANCQNRLYAYVLTLLPDPELARDVVQEANVVMWRKASEFRPGSSFESWACKIAYFEVLVVRRKLKRDRHLFSDDLVQQLSFEAEGKVEGFTDREVALEECLSRLEPEKRRHLQARYGPGGSLKSVADQAKITSGAAAVLLCRIRKALRACVESKLARGCGS